MKVFGVGRLRRAFAPGGIGGALLEASGLRRKLASVCSGSLALRGLPDLSLDWEVDAARPSEKLQSAGRRRGPGLLHSSRT